MVAYLEISGPDLEAPSSSKTLVGRLASAGANWRRCCCCRRRVASLFFGEPLDARTPVISKPEVERPREAEAPQPAAGTEDEEGYSLLETPRLRGQRAADVQREAAPEDDFFDARSEAASECGSPRLALPEHSHPECSRGHRVAEAKDKLEQLLSIECQCRKGCDRPSGSLGNLTVESILQEKAAQLWFCHSKTCPFVIGCLCCTLPDVQIQDAVRAIQDPAMRMDWDGDSYSAFELVREHDATDPVREDVIFTVIPIPRPVLHREILQYRWQVPLGDASGGQALLMQSFEDDALKPPHPQRVRAFTHLSGYILRPVRCHPGEGSRTGGSQGYNALEVVVVSQCDLGGALPSWFQNLARRMAKHRCVAWAKKLRVHCERVAQERAAAA
mmetsp:Transcript_58716/g.166891  ORF Transcript_58716/g.166891 Transcript_58716/m.166891 type:complete len:388 (+) Transcript_58716:68-1231(+)